MTIENLLSNAGNPNAAQAWLSKYTWGSTGIRTVAVNLVIHMTAWVKQLSGLIAEIVPVALPVLGVMVAVFFAIRFIKKVMK